MVESNSIIRYFDYNWIGYEIVQIRKLFRVSNISGSKVLLFRQYMSMVASNLRSDDAWGNSRKELFIEYQWRWEMRIPVNQAIVSLTSLHGELLLDLISYPLLVSKIGFQKCVAFWGLVGVDSSKMIFFIREKILYCPIRNMTVIPNHGHSFFNEWFV